jgi:hypothetical protein
LTSKLEVSSLLVEVVVRARKSSGNGNQEDRSHGRTRGERSGEGRGRVAKLVMGLIMQGWKCEYQARRARLAV